VTLFLCGDVMTGRGVDQILAHPSGSQIFEPYVQDAREYVELAERRSGPISKRVAGTYIWGAGLAETLETLARAGLKTAGAGRSLAEARAAAVVPLENGARLLVFAFGTESSGIPSNWAARDDRPGIDLLPDLSESTAAGICQRIRQLKVSATLSSHPSTGERTGVTRFRVITCGSPVGWSTAALTSSTAIHRTTRARSRCTGSASSCTAAATSSTTMKGSKATSSIGTISC